MSVEDTHHSHISHTGAFTYFLVFMLLLIVSALLVSNNRTRYEDHVASQNELMQTSAQDTVQILQTYIEQTNRMVQLFTMADLGHIRQLAEEPDNEQLIKIVDTELRRYIPDFFAFTIAGDDGEVILDEFEGKVGEVCMADIRYFAEEHPHELMMHPNALQYHFDIMTRMRLSGDQPAVFFVSFKPDVVAQLLANSEIYGHRLLLLNRDVKGLIEVTSQGARTVLGENIRLTDDELASIEISYDVPGTKWKLVYVPGKEYFQSVRDGYNREVIHEILIVFTFSMIMLLLIRFEESRRKEAEAALQKSHDELEDKVRQRTQELRNSEQRYALAAKGANDGIWEWNADTGRIYFSSRWQKIAGVKRALNAGPINSWLKLIHEDDRELFASAFESAVNGQEDGIELVFRFVAHGNTERWCICRAAVEVDVHGKPSRMAGSISDITEQKLAEQQLEHGSLHDALTGLANRSLFCDRLGQSIEMMNRDSDYHYAVMYMSLDRFKSINDNLGHQVGDSLLLIVAERLSSVMRPGDSLARLSADEFVMLMGGYRNVSDVTDLAELLLRTIAHPYSIEGEVMSVTGNLGITLGTLQSGDANDLLRDAGIAMYRAMEQGQGEYFIFNENIRQEVMSRVHTETLLRKAISYQQMKVYYQPIIDLKDESIYSFEALLRWLHPEKGLILPDEFIPLAEDTGLIIPIDLWVMEIACRQLKSWQMDFPEHDDLSLCVNLSLKQFRQSDLVSKVDSLLQQTSVDRSNVSLSLEITESTIMQNASCSADIIGELKELGINFSVDDFGTGYSSLAYLQHFPVDALKIDKQFVSMIDNDEDSRSIVRTVIELGRNLSIKVVAEGVETKQQHVMLREMGCDYAQGFYYSEAVPAEQAKKLLIDGLGI